MIGCGLVEVCGGVGDEEDNCILVVETISDGILIRQR